MSKLEEIQRGRDIGKSDWQKNEKFIWLACVDCGKERWVCLRKGKPVYIRCHSCAAKRIPLRLGEANNNWKGGRIYDGDGYIKIKLQPGDFFYSMADHQGYIYEHRLVIAQRLGRCLESWEIVHHKDDVHDNNNCDNLKIVSDDENKQIAILEDVVSQQRRQIIWLKKQLTLLLKADTVILKDSRTKSWQVLSLFSN